jgi:hypothetical protein
MRYGINPSILGRGIEAHIAERRPTAVEHCLSRHWEEIIVGADAEGDSWPLSPQPPDDDIEAQPLLAVVVDRAEDRWVRPMGVELQHHGGCGSIDDALPPGDLRRDGQAMSEARFEGDGL